MRDRVARLFSRMATLDEARTGEFYNVLPYGEYLAGLDGADREEWEQLVAQNITNSVAAGKYEDASHFFELALGGGPGLVRHIAPEIVSRSADRLISEAADDGGWRTPYDPAWRPWTTTTAMMSLAKLRDGV